MRNVRIQVAYDGSLFFGWQRQDGFPTVQEALEDALAATTGERAVVHGAGRTDTGVHALRQVASFHVETRLDDGRLRGALNAHLPEGIAVLRLETCPDAFHARFSARGKRYAYWIVTESVRPPWAARRAHWVREPLDLARMRAAAAALLGRHDFSAFASSGSPRRTTVRALRSIHLVARRRWLALVLEADGFLYNMARAIAGTLLDVGRGRTGPEEVRAMLASCDRRRAGPTAPPEGLYLLSVQYAEPCFLARDRAAPGTVGGAGPPRT